MATNEFGDDSDEQRLLNHIQTTMWQIASEYGVQSANRGEKSASASFGVDFLSTLTTICFHNQPRLALYNTKHPRPTDPTRKVSCRELMWRIPSAVANNFSWQRLALADRGTPARVSRPITIQSPMKHHMSNIHDWYGPTRSGEASGPTSRPCGSDGPARSHVHLMLRNNSGWTWCPRSRLQM